MLYKRKVPVKLEGNEVFKNSGSNGFSVLKFWQYAFSNLNSNVLRGALAEFFVEMALSDDGNAELRNTWEDYDVVTKKGTKIEVKCCSYLQDWDQNKLSNIVFTGLRAKKIYWADREGSVNYSAENIKDYKSDIYVFALFKHQVLETLDILDFDQWCFYVLPREEISRISKNGSSVSLYMLEKNNIEAVTFSELREKIELLEAKIV